MLFETANVIEVDASSLPGEGSTAGLASFSVPATFGRPIPGDLRIFDTKWKKILHPGGPAADHLCHE
jgi:hypothetical protein